MTHRKRLIAWLLVQAVFWAALTAAVAARGAAPAATGASVIVRGGVARLGTDVYMLDNSTHAVVGITALTLLNGCTLRLTTDWQLGERVIAAVADEDETLSRLGIEAGISGGGQYATVYLYQAGHQVCANDPMFGTVGNLWIQITLTN